MELDGQYDTPYTRDELKARLDPFTGGALPQREFRETRDNEPRDGTVAAELALLGNRVATLEGIIGELYNRLDMVLTADVPDSARPMVLTADMPDSARPSPPMPEPLGQVASQIRGNSNHLDMHYEALHRLVERLTLR